jgi:ribose 1,5-bisphosphokinase
LIYVMGPSGCGKDSLLRYARARLAGDPAVVFAHRYITRAAAAGGENHVELTPAEFATRLRKHLFALTWESHGHAYGVGIEIGVC